MSEREQFEGKTLADAIERASMKFNATRDRIDYRIVKESQGGFFGLLGGKVVIEAWVRGPLSDREYDEKYGIEIPDGKPADKRPAGEGNKGASPGHPDGGDGESGARADGEQGKKRRRRRGRRGKGGPGQEQGQAVEAAPEGGEPLQGHQGRRERRDRPDAADARPLAAEPVTVGPEIETFLKGLLVHLGEEPAFAIEEDAQHVTAKITIAPDSIFSSREGHTIESLKFILDKVVNRGPVIRKRVRVHVSEPASADQGEWAALGAELGRVALAVNKPVAVRGLQPQDRKAIHTALLGTRGVETMSSGEGGFRRLFVVPKGARPAPAKTTPAGEPGPTGGAGEEPDDNFGNR